MYVKYIIDKTIELVTYHSPEEVDIINFNSREMVPTCHVPIMVHNKLRELLIVLELIQLSHDFNILYEKVPSRDHKYLNVDLTRVEKRGLFKGDWNINNNGKGLLLSPEDLVE
ncbi:hypothetical protein EV702DRAFT_1045534 [Suillus placidus]|uniref:Uncharacterized protein n=1 Tax=Suillus placidus TaxID=48579 RepID=A0A9P6ZUZ0_9AGAM|nr:hypothetical protein EV702DRAFT_1045534 [Suillus placidus]